MQENWGVGRGLEWAPTHSKYCAINKQYGSYGITLHRNHSDGKRSEEYQINCKILVRGKKKPDKCASKINT